ncbi:MAG: ABC transporter permease [Clostridiales bacterium]|jgi:oligopeptide transport system permease protein|nr:ABC transporter permease [Clostridiales bacterium]
MARYVLKRFLMLILTLFLVLLFTFAIMHAIPGGPYSAGKRLPEAVRAAIEEKYSLNDPLHAQFLDYLGRAARLDLGPSFKYEGMSVNSLIAQGFPVSATLGLLSMLLVVALGVPLGVLAAVKQGKWQDAATSFVTTFGVAIPSFVAATLLLYFFAYRLGWFPVFGVETLKGYALPTVALSGYSLAYVTRLTRSSLLDVLKADYIRTARVKGLSEGRIVARHGMRNALIPVVTVIGPLFAGLLMGSFVVEKIFALPGMGRFFVQSITNRDYTATMGFTIFYAAVLAVVVFAVDILYCVIDPRIKLEE